MSFTDPPTFVKIIVGIIVLWLILWAGQKDEG